MTRVEHWSWFLAWTVVGVGAVLCAVRLGWVAAAIGIGVWVVAAAWFRQAWRGVFGLPAGFGLVAFGVAATHLHGGHVCWGTGSEAGCDQTLDWHLWLPIGLVAAATGVIGHLVWNRPDRPQNLGYRSQPPTS